MGILSKLFGGKKTAGSETGAAEQAVLLHLKLGNDGFGLEGEVARMHALQEELERAIQTADAGELDGDEFGGGECVVFMYGPDAEKLWAAIEPVLARDTFRQGSYAVKRFGGPEDGRKERIDLAVAGGR